MSDASLIQLGTRYQYHPSEIVQVPFGIGQADRRSHLYVIGKTGMGKTRLIQSMIEQDMAMGHAVGLIDPHGDLSWEILNAVPPDRLQDVVIVDPTDDAWPVSLNLLRAAPQPSTVASGLVAAFEGYFGHSWGPRLE
jgi:DNA helicase HerA-like ATPase